MLVRSSMEARERSDAVTARSRTVLARWQVIIEQHRKTTALPAVHFGLPPSLLARLTLDADRPNSTMSAPLQHLVRNGQQAGAIVPLAADGLKVYACGASVPVAREITAWIREFLASRLAERERLGPIVGRVREHRRIDQCGDQRRRAGTGVGSPPSSSPAPSGQETPSGEPEPDEKSAHRPRRSRSTGGTC
jgi:hypothetical protein